MMPYVDHRRPPGWDFWVFLTFALVVGALALSLGGCAGWQVDEVSATVRHDVYDDAYDTDGYNDGVEATIIWRRKQ